ncbi:MAG: T9SS type A sorting domain-containing protein [Bacteroidota bacterium]
MKKLLTMAAVLLSILSTSLSAQAKFDTTKFTISATFKPSSYPEWSDSVAAWRVYGSYDLDKDGKREFLVIVDPATTFTADTSMPTILRFEASANNKYDLVWSAKIPYQNAAKGSWPCLTVGDIDKDGLQEIIFGEPLDARSSVDVSPNRLFIYEYDPVLGNFPKLPTLESKLGFPDKYYYAVTSVIADDVDKDGDVELIFSARRAYGGGSGTAALRPLFIYHLIGSIEPGFSDFEREFADTLGTFNGGYYFNNHVVDFNGNGKKEIWGFTWDMIAYAVYEATGKDTYELKADVNQASSPVDYGEQNSVSFYDANKDGKLEMFLGGQASPPSAVFYLPNTADLTTLSTSSMKIISPIQDAGNFQGADIGDIDGDGEVDFFVGDWNNATRKVYRLSHIKGKAYDDSVGYTFDTLYSAPADSNYRFPNVTVLNDVDGDGKREIALVNTAVRGDHPEEYSIVILESKVVVLSVNTISEKVPAAFTLSQNYPNPFNPSSAIRFALKTEGHVELFITNSLGQQVATLVNENMSAGTHEVKFNADGLATGTYFYTMKSGSFTETKKMLLVK